MEYVIKFSNDHPKLWGQKKGELLAVRRCFAGVVHKNKDLLEYDTKNCKGEYYQLPKHNYLIQLIFLGDKQIPFCTLRRFDRQKYDFYQNNVGEIFDILIGEGL
jgi:hypothetical protein